jgi:hypothetical protein
VDIAQVAPVKSLGRAGYIRDSSEGGILLVLHTERRGDIHQAFDADDGRRVVSEVQEEHWHVKEY